jgi:hypothetical protein
MGWATEPAVASFQHYRHVDKSAATQSETAMTHNLRHQRESDLGASLAVCPTLESRHCEIRRFFLANLTAATL